MTVARDAFFKHDYTESRMLGDFSVSHLYYTPKWDAFNVGARGLATASFNNTSRDLGDTVASWKSNSADAPPPLSEENMTANLIRSSRSRMSFPGLVS